jgi:hypothetical protein
VPELGERVGEARQFADGARRSRFAVEEKGLGEARRGDQLGVGERIEPGLRRRNRNPFAREPLAALQENFQRQPSAERRGEFQRERPAADRAGNGQRGVRSARRDRIVAEFPVTRDRRVLAGEAASLDRPHRLGVADQPEAVAADRVHVGIDDGHGRRHRDHRLDRVAALREHVAARLGGQMMRRGDGGVGVDGFVGQGGAPRRFDCAAGPPIPGNQQGIFWNPLVGGENLS